MSEARGTRWLDADQQASWRAFAVGVTLLLDRLDADLQRAFDLSLTEYEILVRLSEAPEHTLRMSQLASTSLSSRSRLSHAVARMEEAGWIRRLPYPDDRRGALAQLTDEGMARLEAAAPAHVEQVRSLLFDPLTPDQLAALREISDRLAAHLSDTPRWPAAPDEPACDDEAEATTR